MIKELGQVTAMVEARDRRQWPILLAVSLVAGVSRSMILVLINAGIGAHAHPRVLLLDSLGVLVSMGITLLASRFFAVRGHEVSTRLAMSMRRRLRRLIGTADLRFVERETVSTLHYHLMVSVAVISEMYGAFLAYVGALVTLVINFVYIGWLSPTGLAAGVVITVIGISVHLRQERVNKHRWWQFDRMFKTYSHHHRAFLDGFKELRLSVAKDRDYGSRIDADADSLVGLSVDERRTSADGALATDFFKYLMIGLICLGLPQVSSISVTTVMQLLSAILFTTAPLEGVVDFFPKYGRARVALSNLTDLENHIAKVEDIASRDAPPPLPAFESITLRNVAFEFQPGASVDARDDGFRLGPINLSVQRGEVIFVVGGNGSGKTVLMRLLTGLYRPTAGELLYNGVPLGEDLQQSYREQFATVFTDFYLFDELLGRRDTPAAVVDDWIRRYDLEGKTRLLDGRLANDNLSTGQRKRLALLVSVLEERPLLVLDEFGAEQDPEHRERFYREWLPQLRALGKTLVLVSHDDRYFDCADRVIRMDYGRITEIRTMMHAERLGKAPRRQAP